MVKSHKILQAELDSTLSGKLLLLLLLLLGPRHIQPSTYTNVTAPW